MVVNDADNKVQLYVGAIQRHVGFQKCPGLGQRRGEFA